MRQDDDEYPIDWAHVILIGAVYAGMAATMLATLWLLYYWISKVVG